MNRDIASFTSTFAIATALMAVSTVAHAQTATDRAATASQEATADEEAATGRIVVTGSRLKVDGFSELTPVTVLGIEQIEERAPTNIIDVLNQLPAFRSDRSDTNRGALNSSAGNQSLLDLRGLGATRNLVLINGHRHVSTNFTGSVDTNVVPIGLVERVEVVTGGASAAYGSDAVAGVTNILLRERMEGITGSLQAGTTKYGDGEQYTATIAGGTSFAQDRGHIIFGFDYNRSEAIESLYERPWGAVEPGTYAAGAGRSSTTPAMVLAEGVEPATSAQGGLITTPVGGQFYAFNADGAPYVFDRGTVYGPNMVGSTANYGLVPSLTAPVRVPGDRRVAYGRVEFEATEGLKLFAEANYARSRTFELRINEFTSNFVLSSTDTRIPESIRSQLATPTVTIGRVNTDFGGFTTQQDNEIHRYLLGVGGELFGNFEWEAYYQHGKAHQTLIASGVVTSALLTAANNCSTARLTAAQLTQYASFLSLMGNRTCVPFNPIGETNSAAAIAYFMEDQQQETYNKQDVYAASISGSPFSTWAGPVAIATGAEWRRESLNTVTKYPGAAAMFSQGNFTAFGGENSVREGFFEIGVPLAHDVAFARSLDLNGAVRLTDYEIGGTVTTWKLGTTWEPIDQLRLRVTRSRDIRAPTLDELYFIGGNIVAPGLFNSIPNGTVGMDGTINTRFGALGDTAQNTITRAVGSTSVIPEIADTWTVGGVLSLGRFRASVDYYNIKLKGAISRALAQGTIDQCAQGDAVACDQIRFDTSPDGFELVLAESTNLDQLKMSGIDVELAYRQPEPLGLPGRFDFRLLLNHSIENEQTAALTGIVTDSAGTFGGQPNWSWNLTLGYEVGRLSANIQLRGFDGLRANPIIYNADGSVNSTTILGPEDAGYDPAAATSVSQNHFAGRAYTSIGFQYAVTDNVSVFGNVDNLFNVGPPRYTVNARYDLVGTQYKAGLRFNFN